MLAAELAHLAQECGRVSLVEKSPSHRKPGKQGTWLEPADPCSQRAGAASPSEGRSWDPPQPTVLAPSSLLSLSQILKVSRLRGQAQFT